MVIIQISTLFVYLWNKFDSVCQLDLSFDYILTAIERILCSTQKTGFLFILSFATYWASNGKNSAKDF